MACQPDIVIVEKKKDINIICIAIHDDVRMCAKELENIDT